MKILLSIILITFVQFLTLAQITLEKGYFIDNDGNRVECYIKNSDWRSNPREIKYSLAETGNLEKHTITSVQEFGVYGYSKYIRRKVLIDKSTSDLNKLSRNRNQEFQEQVVFLKVLVEGPATLYKYSQEELLRFFYRVDTSEIRQLVYKKYSIDLVTSRENESYKQQLLVEVNCNKKLLKTINTIAYQDKPLINYFRDENLCKGDSSVEYKKAKQNDYFNLKITPGINLTTINIIAGRRDIDSCMFGSQKGFRLGLEGEFIFPYNKGKWRLVFEPTYQYFNSKPLFPFPYTRQLNFKSIEFPLGLRYYSFLNKDFKLFYNLFLNPSWSYNFNTIIRSEFGADWKTKPSTSFILGSGLEWKRLSVEARYYTNRRVFVQEGSTYTRLAIVLGFKIF